MKKFLVVFCVLLITVLVGRHLIIYEHFYIDLKANVPSVALYSADNEFIYDNTGAEQKKLALKGVILDSIVPGSYTTDYEVTLEEYDRWLVQIAEMGSNTIVVDGIMDSEFYSAFQAYNLSSEEPLYLLQGVRIPSYEANNADDFYGYYDEMMDDVHRTVDVIHGFDFFALGRMESGGTYNVDVSQWTIGYILGNEWTPYTVAYTDNNSDLPISYQGEFFSSSDDATRTEVFITDVMDQMMSYESHRYKTQRLMTFNNNYLTDPLEYTETVQVQLEKFVSMNIDNIVASDNVLSGTFAGYIMKAGMEDFLSCLSDDDIRKYIDIISLVDPDSIYGGYVDFLNRLHDVPVVITSYGHSTARVVDTIADHNFWDDRLTEQQQGEALVANYNEFTELGCQGAIIASWQDNWSRTTWNTEYAIDSYRTQYWHDTQTKDASNGILAFDTSDGGEVCYVDGDISEWDSDDVLVSGDDLSLAVKYDEGYLYLMVQGEKVGAEPFFIPFDVTPKTGSFTERDYELRMSHASDFILFVEGADNTRLLVQERYDAARAGHEEFISTVNPYTDPPSPTGNLFVPIRVVADKALDPSIELGVFNTIYDYYLFNVDITGDLVHGNANPNSPDYNSLADFYLADGVVEIRIPWQLLNFADPSEMTVHNDYYPVYGVEEISVDGINIGVNYLSASNRTQMQFYELEGWGEDITYVERLKKSYDIVKQAWTAG